jgi:hypothetical protein
MAFAQKQGPVISCTDKNGVFNAGNINKGDDFEHEFEFTNTGDKPLVISEVQSNGDEDNVSFENHPIMPGETGTIKVVEDSDVPPGPITRKIVIVSNASNSNGDAKRFVLTLKGTIVDKDDSK